MWEVLSRVALGLLWLVLQPLQVLYNILYSLLDTLLFRPLHSTFWTSKALFVDVPYRVLSALSPGLIFLTVAAITGILLGGIGGWLSEGVSQVLCGSSVSHVAADAEDAIGYFDEEDKEHMYDGEEEQVADDEPPVHPERFMNHANFYMDESWDSSDESAAGENLNQGYSLENPTDEEEGELLRRVTPSGTESTKTTYPIEASSVGNSELEDQNRPKLPANTVSSDAGSAASGRFSPAESTANLQRSGGHRAERGAAEGRMDMSTRLSRENKARAMEKGREAARRRVAMQQTLLGVADRDSEPAFTGDATAALLTSPHPIAFSAPPNGNLHVVNPADVLAVAPSFPSTSSPTARSFNRVEGSLPSSPWKRSYQHGERRHSETLASVPGEYRKASRFSILRKRDRHAEGRRRLASLRPPPSESSSTTISSVLSNINSSTIGRSVRGVTAAIGSRMTGGRGGAAAKNCKQKGFVVDVGAEM